MSFTSADTLDYFYHDTKVDKGWNLDISGELVGPGEGRYPIAESVAHAHAHAQADKVDVVMLPSTPPHSDCGQSDDIPSGTERQQQQQRSQRHQQRRNRPRRHRGEKGQGQQQQQLQHQHQHQKTTPETSTSSSMPVQKWESAVTHDGAVANDRMRSFSLPTKKIPLAAKLKTDKGSVRAVVTVTATAASEVYGYNHRDPSEPSESHENPQPMMTSEKKQRLYKTELCRNWEELDHCRYGDKCQYAHGLEDLRDVERHPKYKTQVCRTFYQVGSCPYGTRCTFRHLHENSPRLPAPPSTSSSSSSLSRKSPRTSSFGVVACNNTPLSLDNNNNVILTDAESLLPTGLLVDLDEPPPAAFAIRPRSSILQPCFPSNNPSLVDSSVWKHPNRAVTL